MAEEEKEELEEEGGEAEAAPSVADKLKAKSGIIIIAVLVVVGLVLAGVIAFFVTTKLVANNANNANNEHSDKQEHDPGVFIKLGDDKEGLIVNVGGVKGGHFLKIGMVLEMNPSKKQIIDAEGKINKIAETRILDTTLQILRSEKFEAFEANKQDELKKKLIEELNKVLGNSAVYNIYITSIVLQ